MQALEWDSSRVLASKIRIQFNSISLNFVLLMSSLNVQCCFIIIHFLCFIVAKANLDTVHSMLTWPAVKTSLYLLVWFPCSVDYMVLVSMLHCLYCPGFHIPLFMRSWFQCSIDMLFWFPCSVV